MLIEPILLFGPETWTLTSRQGQRLDGTYTNLLPRAQSIPFSEHATRSQEPHLRKSSTTLPEARQVATSIRWLLPESYGWDYPVPLTMEAKWPYPLQKIDLSRHDCQGLRDRKVRSRERYGGSWSLRTSRPWEANNDDDDGSLEKISAFLFNALTFRREFILK